MRERTPSRRRARGGPDDPEDPDGEGLLTLRFSLEGVPAQQQVAFWQSLAPQAYRVRSNNIATAPIDARSTICIVDRLLVTSFQSRSHFVERPREAIEKEAGRFVKVRLYLEGESRLFDGTHSMRLGSNAVYLIDQSRPWRVHHKSHRTLNIFLPHVLVGYDPGRFPVCHEIPLRSPIGRILRTAIESFLGELPAATRAEAPALAAVLTGLVGGAVRARAMDLRTSHMKMDGEFAFQSFIERHLDDPELGIASLTEAFGASRSTIYRAFSRSGGLGRYILKRRLDHAFQDLAHGSSRRGVVRATAESWHFSSVSHFSNAFSKRFGFRPSQVIGLHHDGSETAREEEPVDLPPSLIALRTRLAAIYESFTR